MRQPDILFQPNSLQTKLITTTQHALQSGALQSIPTDYEFVEDRGIHFLVRISSNLIRKDKAKQKQTERIQATVKPINPFLPYEEDLFVTNISPTHLCLLNKYNVIENHLLIVTRVFEEQDCWLNLEDFVALWACLKEIDGLGFYNGGKLAGSSQPHKHLQLVPFPLSPDGRNMPIEPVIATANFQLDLNQITQFSFVHALAKLNFPNNLSLLELAQETLKIYYQFLERIGLPFIGEKQTGAYNLLITRQWMLMIARSQESYESIAVNSLGFVGALFVRNQSLMALLKQYRPLTILKQVAKPL